MERKNIFWLCVVFFVFFNSSYQRGFSQSSQSISELESICEKNEKEGNWLELSKCQTKIGFLYRDQQNYQKSIEWMRKAIISNEKVGNLNGIKNLYANIGLMYSELNNYDEAIECFQKSLKINEQQNKKSDILSDLINIAQAQQNKHN